MKLSCLVNIKKNTNYQGFIFLQKYNILANLFIYRYKPNFICEKKNYIIFQIKN